MPFTQGVESFKASSPTKWKNWLRGFNTQWKITRIYKATKGKLATKGNFRNRKTWPSSQGLWSVKRSAFSAWSQAMKLQKELDKDTSLLITNTSRICVSEWGMCQQESVIGTPSHNQVLSKAWCLLKQSLPKWFSQEVNPSRPSRQIIV